MGKRWHQTSCVRASAEKVAVKMYDDGEFVGSIIIPTELYPLNNKPVVFHYENTSRVTDERVLEVFDSVRYEIGHCYTNTLNLVSRLQENGFDAKSYVGWLFVGDNTTPIHHCWCVLGDSVLDLSDDYSVMYSKENAKNFEGKSYEECQLLIADFCAVARNYPNRQRCAPVGTPSPSFLYVGCECSPIEGREIYRKLMGKFPNHECERNCDANGYNPTQKVFKEKGLI